MDNNISVENFSLLLKVNSNNNDCDSVNTISCDPIDAINYDSFLSSNENITDNENENIGINEDFLNSLRNKDVPPMNEFLKSWTHQFNINQAA